MTEERSREIHTGFEELQHVPTAALKAFHRFLARRDSDATQAAGESAQNVVNPMYLETQIAYGSEARAVRRLAGDVESLIKAREEADMEELGESIAKPPARIFYGEE